MKSVNSSSESIPQIRIIPIFANEIAASFSFYSLATILPLFLKNNFFFGSAIQANTVLHLWKALVFLTPIIGAFLADILYGKFRTILYFSILCVLGHFIIPFSIKNNVLFLFGLFLVGGSAGIIKSSISPFLGQQVEGLNNATLKTKVFNWLYFSINLGGAICQIFVPLVRDRFGYFFAFTIAAISRSVALIILWLPRKHYVKDEQLSSKRLKEVYSKSNLLNMQKSCFLFLFMIVYFALYDESTGAFIFQADKLNRQFMGVMFASDQIQFCNPLFILIMIPVFTKIIYPLLQNKYGIVLTIIQKIKCGFLLLLITYLIIIIIQVNITYHPCVIWQILAYFFLTVSEILVCVSCFEYAYIIAGPHIKSIITSIFLLSLSFGNLFVSWLNMLIKKW